MSLADVWFVLFVGIVAGYLILDGFDFGVGILHLVVAKNDRERRLVLNSIGPVWDGNEVWIVLAGGVLFAAFPFVYASLFSGFYLAFVLVLLVMILRTVALEFRSKRESSAWRSTWDAVFAISSLGLALLLGVAFGNIISGVALDSSGEIDENLIDLLSPFALLVGVTGVSMFALHGANYLAIKTEGPLEGRVRRYRPWLLGAFFVLVNITVVVTGFQDLFRKSFEDDPWLLVIPAAGLLSFAWAWRSIRANNDTAAFVASSAVIASLLITGAAGMYPNMLPSSTNDDYNLTVDNASSANNTLTVMLVAAAIGLPLILTYTSGVYYFFRGKTELGQDSY